MGKAGYLVVLWAVPNGALANPIVRNPSWKASEALQTPAQLKLYLIPEFVLNPAERPPTTTLSCQQKKANTTHGKHIPAKKQRPLVGPPFGRFRSNDMQSICDSALEKENKANATNKNEKNNHKKKTKENKETKEQNNNKQGKTQENKKQTTK